MTTEDFGIDHLGDSDRISPLKLSVLDGDGVANFTPFNAAIRVDPSGNRLDNRNFELAGPRERVYFDGPESRAAIVTCGGLCPGINNVIRSVVLSLWRGYGVRSITGFRYGFRGMCNNTPDEPIALTPQVVNAIHRDGGSILGSSRGARDPQEMVQVLIDRQIDMLFCVGGDGTMRGVSALFEVLKKRDVDLSIVGIPKTIDNDISYVERTFGYETAVSAAVQSVRSARVEAAGAPNCVGLVKLMGRHAGFVAASTVLAARDVDAVLIPEQPFSIQGPGGLLGWLGRRLEERGEAVIIVAEGAGQDHLAASGGCDASGNAHLGDIGVFLRDRIKAAFSDVEFNLKYIDPSYIIRSVPASPTDAVYCGQLADNAVHAAMSGKTGLVIGSWLGRFTHVPVRAVIAKPKHIDLDGVLWRGVLETTGQPPQFQ